MPTRTAKRAEVVEAPPASLQSRDTLARPLFMPLPQSLDEALGTWRNDGLAVHELTSDWELVEKDQLIGVPFFIYNIRFSKGIGKAGEFVSVQVIDKDDRRMVFNDGGSGVYAQLVQWTEETGQAGGLYCPHGLRVSEYDHPEYGHSKTFYLAN